MNPPQSDKPDRPRKEQEGPVRDRKARLAEQLRANLQRRKAQARLRRAGPAGPAGPLAEEGRGDDEGESGAGR